MKATVCSRVKAGSARVSTDTVSDPDMEGIHFFWVGDPIRVESESRVGLSFY